MYTFYTENVTTKVDLLTFFSFMEKTLQIKFFSEENDLFNFYTVMYTKWRRFKISSTTLIFFWYVENNYFFTKICSKFKLNVFCV